MSLNLLPVASSFYSNKVHDNFYLSIYSSFQRRTKIEHTKSFLIDSERFPKASRHSSIVYQYQMSPPNSATSTPVDVKVSRDKQ